MTDSFYESLEARGLTRRAFLTFCGSIAAAIGIKGVTGVEVAEAIEKNSLIGKGTGALAPVIWMELGSCTGCTESFAQSDDPDPATLLLEYLALNYSETLSAAAGYSLEESREQTIEAAKGKYILVIEGAVMTGWDGNALIIAGEPTCAPGESPLLHTAQNAAAVIAAGSCAVDGGFCAAEPNPAGACGVQKYLADNGCDTPVVNVPSCPVNPATLVAVIVQYLLLGTLPALNEYNMPQEYFGETIHDNCPRRGHFENGEFVYQFGSKEEELGYCLYPLGCKGPQTYSNCGVTMWNNRPSWCIQAGSPCLGCCEANPNDPGDNWVEVNTPFYERHRDLHIGDFFFQPTTIGLGLTGLVAVALVIHGFGMKKSGRSDGGAPFEKRRKWDEKHPDQSIGQYEYSIMDGDPLKVKAAVEAQHLENDALAAEAAAKEAAKAAEKAAEVARKKADKAKADVEAMSAPAAGAAEAAAEAAPEVEAAVEAAPAPEVEAPATSEEEGR